MNTSSIVIESKDFPEHQRVQDHRVVVPQKSPVKDKKFVAIRRRIYRHIIETIQSGVLVSACLAVYKITGLHDWWIQFVLKILSTP